MSTCYTSNKNNLDVTLILIFILFQYLIFIWHYLSLLFHSFINKILSLEYVGFEMLMLIIFYCPMINFLYSYK